MALYDRICMTCNAPFRAAPHAKYCPDCRALRIAEQDRQQKARRREGKAREIGSSDLCVVCGQPYIVTGSVQKYCPSCRPVAYAEVDRKGGLAYYYDNRDAINPARLESRRSVVVCAVCGKEFAPGSKSKTCSPECWRQYQNARARAFRARQKEKENAHKGQN